MENLKKYKALLFDCDGTLADTMSAHMEAYKYVFAHFAFPFTEEEFYEHAPAGGKNLMKKMITDKGIDFNPQRIIDMKAKIISDFLDEHMVKNDVLIELIKRSHGKVKIAVVSNGRRQSITSILKKLEIFDLIDVFIAAEDVEKAKPNPEPYLLALKQLGVKASQAVVFEDNEIGFKSAKAARLDVCMVKINEKIGEPE